MSKHFHVFAVQVGRRILALGAYSLEALHYAWNGLRLRTACVPMEILVASGTQRRKIKRELRTGLRQLRQILGDLPLADVRIVVQQSITTDRQLAGCCHLGHYPDGTPSALWRLALQVNRRALSSDELLAVLAEQWIALAQQQNGSSVLLPVDLEPREPEAARRPSTLRPDPLMPDGDGVHPHRA